MSDWVKLFESSWIKEALRPLVIAPGTCFLVGGVLRDVLLGREALDFDFATPDDPTPLAQNFAAKVGGRWFVLDAARRQSRVVVRQAAEEPLTFDFAPFRAPDLTGDLALRDFTVNALACDLFDGTFHDPLGGRSDLNVRLLRQCSPRTFDDDPLRVLRAVRLAQTLDFAIEAGTWSEAQKRASRLAGAAAERRGDEVVQIFEARGCEKACRRLADLGAFELLFSVPARLPELATVLEKLDALDARLHAARPHLAGAWTTAVGRGLTRRGRLRLAAVLRSGGVGVSADELEKRLALGRTNARCLAALTDVPAPARSDLAGVADSTRARALWADRHPFPVDRLLFQSALAGEAARREALLEALDAYLAVQVDGRVPDLVDGRWLAEKAGIPPGPELGKILESLRDAERAGEVASPAEVLSFLAARGEKSVDNENGGAL